MCYSGLYTILTCSSAIANVSDKLQNVMLQHTSIKTFIAYYSVGIDVDVQAIVRGLLPNKQLMWLACLMS
jgi:hypothetical protein